MEYILSEKEYSDLKHKIDKKANLPTIEELQIFCSFVADNLILTEGWKKGKTWDCILTAKHGDGYCDDCPAKKLCPHTHKEWSK